MRGYLSPAMRGWALALCKSDETSFDQFIERSIPQFAGLSQPATTSATPPHAARAARPLGGSAEEIAICEQLGLKVGSLVD